MGNKSNIRDILPAAERCVLGETGKGGVTAGRQVSMHNEHYQHIMQASTIKGNKLKKKNLWPTFGITQQITAVLILHITFFFFYMYACTHTHPHSQCRSSALLKHLATAAFLLHVPKKVMLLHCSRQLQQVEKCDSHMFHMRVKEKWQDSKYSHILMHVHIFSLSLTTKDYLSSKAHQ